MNLPSVEMWAIVQKFCWSLVIFISVVSVRGASCHMTRESHLPCVWSILVGAFLLWRFTPCQIKYLDEPLWYGGNNIKLHYHTDYVNHLVFPQKLHFQVGDTRCYSDSRFDQRNIYVFLWFDKGIQKSVQRCPIGTLVCWVINACCLCWNFKIKYQKMNELHFHILYT